MSKNLTVTRSGVIRTRVTLSGPARVTLQLRQGKKVVRSANYSARKGTNVLPFRVTNRAGRYQLVVIVRGTNGATATANGTVRVRLR